MQKSGDEFFLTEKTENLDVLGSLRQAVNIVLNKSLVVDLYFRNSLDHRWMKKRRDNAIKVQVELARYEVGTELEIAHQTIKVATIKVAPEDLAAINKYKNLTLNDKKYCMKMDQNTSYT